MSLLNLQDYLASNKIDAFILKISDSHQSEYVIDHFNAIKHFTGFTGSNATLFITPNKAIFYTDSRYFLQSEIELSDKNITLAHKYINNFMCSDQEITCDINNIIATNSNIYLQGELFSIDFFKQLEVLTKDKNIYINLHNNILDSIWDNRPACKFNTIYAYPSHLSSSTIKQKISIINKAMLKEKVDYYLVSSLDDIAYFTHLRGSDIPFNPLFFSYLLFTPKNIILFINLNSLSDSVKKTLSNYFTLLDYTAFNSYISEINSSSIFLDSKRNNALIYKKLSTKLTIKTGLELIEKLKISKNNKELESIAKAHIKDGVAMLKFLKYISFNNSLGTAWDLSQILISYRQEQDGFTMQSFSPIIAFKQDGAIVHHSIKKENTSKIIGNGLLLVDTGAHYLGGTTDLTRTIAIGEATYQEKKNYTLVLKAHINLANTAFKPNTKASNLDNICRSQLQKFGLDYGHGTGHGVGAMLSVHEGQTRINKICQNRLPKHFVCSIEPGLYLTGEYGIRLENLYYTEARLLNYKFKVLTLAPFDKSLILKDLLTKTELRFINNYHKLVYKKLKDYLDKDDLLFLKEQTKIL